MSQAFSRATPAFLQGGGEMGERIADAKRTIGQAKVEDLPWSQTRQATLTQLLTTGDS